MPDVTLPTPGEVEEMRTRHKRWPGRETHCFDDGQRWPCDAARLLTLVDNQTTTLDEDRRYMRRQDDRLHAVLDECDRMEHEYPYRRAEDIARIRRAATGEQP